MSNARGNESRGERGGGDDGPVRIGDLLGALLAKYGYADLESRKALEAAWQGAADDKTRKHTRLGSLRRGTLEILVDNAPLLQELEGFRKDELTAAMRLALRTKKFERIKFRRA